MYRVRLTEASRWVFSRRAQVGNKEVSFVSRRSICQSRMTKKFRDFMIGGSSSSISPDNCVRIYYNLLTLEVESDGNLHYCEADLRNHRHPTIE